MFLKGPIKNYPPPQGYLFEGLKNVTIMKKVTKLFFVAILFGMAILPLGSANAEGKDELKKDTAREDNCDLVILQCANGNGTYLLLCGTDKEKDEDFALVRKAICG
jgi:hypothetical protein